MEAQKEIHLEIKGDDDHNAAAKNPAPNAVEQTTKIQRIFDFYQIFAFSLSSMAIWTGMLTNMWFALYNGGPQTFAWSIVIAYVGALSQSASLAEMASIQPIAGAQYHWTHALAPESGKRFITWMQGWVTWFSWVSLLAGIANVNAGLLQSLASLGNPTYVGKGWHATLIMHALILSHAAINIFAYRLVPHIESFASILLVGLFLVFLGVLAAMGGAKHTAEYVWTFQQTSSGWNDVFVSWNIGMLTCVWSFTGFDGALHMGEEVRRARHAVPRALFWSVALNGLLAYAIVLVILFSMGSLEEDLRSSWPVVVIVGNVTGSTSATIALISLLFVLSYCVGLAAVSTVSRLTWAWARDRGLPRSIALVSPKYGVPVRAVLLSSVLVMLLALLNIGSTAAFGAIIALSSLGLYMSYFVAISCMLCRRSLGKEPLQLGGWNLGRWGPFINAYAIVHTVWVIVFLPWPTTLPVTAVNMNYASPLFAFCVLFALVTWYGYAKVHWPGPNVEVIEYVMSAES